MVAYLTQLRRFVATSEHEAEWEDWLSDPSQWVTGAES